VWPVLLIDCIVIKIRDGAVQNRPVYVVMGIRELPITPRVAPTREPAWFESGAGALKVARW
jgi:hypothetical protein